MISKPTDAIAGISGSSGCKMAYGEGMGLSGLPFTPYIAIYIAKPSTQYVWCFCYVAIRGTNKYLHAAANVNSIAECTFDTNSVYFSTPPSTVVNGANTYTTNPYIVAFGY